MKKIFSFLMIVSCLFAFSWQTKALTYTVTVPEGTQYCFIAGDMNGWNLGIPSQMTPVEGKTNQFTIDYPNAKLTDTYKYLCGPGWDYQELNADGNELSANRTYAVNDVVVQWPQDGFVADNRTVTINVLVPSAVSEVYLVGNFNNWSSDFNNSPYKMNLSNEDIDGKYFTINITWVDVINMQFKFVAGPDWAYQQTEDDYTYGTTDNVINIDEKNFQAIFDPTQAGDITIKATVPEGTEKVWIQGSFSAAGWGWGNPDALLMTKQDDGTFTYTVQNVQSFTYKLYNGPDWPYCEYAEGNPDADVPDRTATLDSSAPVISINVFGWRQDAPVETTGLTYTVTVPEGTQACFITGDMDGWSGPSLSNRMTPVEGQTNQFTIDIPGATEADEYKYYCGPSWSYEEANADGSAVNNRGYALYDVVAKWSKDFTLDERTVTINVQVPSAVVDLYLVGDFNGWSNDFKNSQYKMNYVSEDADGKIFTVNVTWIDVFNMQFKFVAGPDYAYQQTEDNYTYGTTDNVINIFEQNFNKIYDPTKVGDVTITATVPEGTDRVWIMGSWTGWNWGSDPESPALEMTKQVDGTFTYTVTDVVEFTYNLYNWPGGDWSYVEATEDGLSKYPDRSASTDDKDVHITVYAWMKDAPTGIPQVSNVNAFNAYSANGQIIVNGTFSQVSVFDLTGRIIQSVKTFGSFTSKSLPKGIYIVRVDNVPQKVIVR